MTKPGYKTTEFWITFIIQIMNALVQSGLIGDGTQLVKGLSFAAAALTAIVYAITRAQVKAAASADAPDPLGPDPQRGSSAIDLMLLIAFGACIVGAIACGALKSETKGVAGDVVDCTTTSALSSIKQFGPTVDSVLVVATNADKTVDVDRIKDAARGFATDAARCVLADAIARALNPKADDPNAPKSSPLEADPVALRQAFAELAGGKSYHTEHGTL